MNSNTDKICKLVVDAISGLILFATYYYRQNLVKIELHVLVSLSYSKKFEEPMRYSEYIRPCYKHYRPRRIDKLFFGSARIDKLTWHIRDKVEKKKKENKI